MAVFERKRFLRALELLESSMARGRATIPILDHAKLVSHGARAIIEATDLDNSMRVALHDDGPAQLDSTLPSVRRLRAAVAASDGDTITISGKSEKYTPRKGEETLKYKTRVTAGSLSLDMYALPVGDFPGIGSVEDTVFSADLGRDELAQIARVVCACSHEETRYYLRGVCVHKVGDWTYRFAATDGHRLHIVDIPLPNATGAIPDGTIITFDWLRIALARFAKARDGCRLYYGYCARRNEADAGTLVNNPLAHRIAISATLDGVDASLTGKLIDGTFPDYTRVIPTGYELVARFKKADMVRAIRSLSPMSPKKNVRACKIQFEDGALALTLNSPDLGEGRVAIPAQHNIPSSHAIGINGLYALDAAAVLRGDEMELHFAKESGLYPIVFKDPADTAFKGVLMPMRI